MDARSELLAYLGSTLITIIGLFGLQQWYASYLDTSVVHGSNADVPMSAGLVEKRSAEHAKLEGGKLSIDAAKAALAKTPRTQLALIAPKPSDDLSAMSGWMHKPGFKPYTPRAAAVPQQQAAPEGAAAPAEGAAAPAEGAAAPAEGAAPAQPAQGAPAAAPAAQGAGH
jgi:hypothetical protein